MELFLKRNPDLTYRKPKAIQKQRESESEASIRNWFSELTDYLTDNDLMWILEAPERIFYFDESGFSLKNERE